MRLSVLIDIININSEAMFNQSIFIIVGSLKIIFTKNNSSFF